MPEFLDAGYFPISMKEYCDWGRVLRKMSGRAPVICLSNHANPRREQHFRQPQRRFHLFSERESRVFCICITVVESIRLKSETLADCANALNALSSLARRCRCHRLFRVIRAGIGINPEKGYRRCKSRHGLKNVERFVFRPNCHERVCLVRTVRHNVWGSSPVKPIVHGFSV
jgi:hypothetical protein